MAWRGRLPLVQASVRSPPAETLVASSRTSVWKRAKGVNSSTFG
jgi:hypothetical protein